ncbi:cystathionine beta-lyase [Streptococcus iniae]
MTDYCELALAYGGFTSLDVKYLENLLKQPLNHEQKLYLITPPPSVINAYFAEIYQKQVPQAATDYYYKLSQELALYQNQPSFAEEKPFVRLNLSGKSYGFSYQEGAELALVFSEEEQAIKPDVCFELAQIFPHYLVFVDHQHIKMSANPFESSKQNKLSLPDNLLTEGFRIDEHLILLKSFNLEELKEVSQQFKGQFFYGFEQREFTLYIKE